MLRRYLKPHLATMAIATGLSLALGLVSAMVYGLVGPALKVLMTPEPSTRIPLIDLFGENISRMLETATGRHDFAAAELWAVLPLLLLSLAAVRAICGAASWFLWERTGEQVSRDIRAHMMGLYLFSDPIRRADDMAKADEKFASVLTNDVRLTREFIVHYYGGFPRELLQVIFYAVTLVLLSPRLFAIFAVGIVPAGLLLSRLGKKLKKRAASALDDFSLLSEWLQERLLGMETIKHDRTERLEIAKMTALSRGLFTGLMRAARVKARTSPILEAIAIVAMVVILYVALADISAGRSTGSIQLSFFSTLAILSQAASKLGRYFNSNKEGAAAIDRIDALEKQLSAERRESLSAHRERRGRAQLICEELTVQYPSRPFPALSSFSFVFEAGKVYGVMGRSGAGKSSLFKAILGLVNYKGVIVEGDEIRIGFMPQETLLIPDRLVRNISYPERVADRERVRQVLERVGLKPWLESLPDGIDTIIGTEGVGMSGGQAQRISLARLLYHRYPCILIDEGTSALDPETEQIIYRVLREQAQDGATVILITHRPSTLAITDKVLTLENGCLVPS